MPGLTGTPGSAGPAWRHACRQAVGLVRTCRARTCTPGGFGVRSSRDGTCPSPGVPSPPRYRPAIRWSRLQRGQYCGASAAAPRTATTLSLPPSVPGRFLRNNHAARRIGQGDPTSAHIRACGVCAVGRPLENRRQVRLQCRRARPPHHRIDGPSYGRGGTCELLQPAQALLHQHRDNRRVSACELLQLAQISAKRW